MGQGGIEAPGGAGADAQAGPGAPLGWMDGGWLTGPNQSQTARIDHGWTAGTDADWTAGTGGGWIAGTERGEAAGTERGWFAGTGTGRTAGTERGWFAGTAGGRTAATERGWAAEWAGLAVAAAAAVAVLTTILASLAVNRVVWPAPVTAARTVSGGATAGRLTASGGVVSHPSVRGAEAAGTDAAGAAAVAGSTSRGTSRTTSRSTSRGAIAAGRPAARATPAQHRKAVSAVIPARRLLAYGMYGPDVRRLQGRLAQLGYYPGPRDGSFGIDTLGAVRAFQEVQRLAPTGEVDQQMDQALGHPRTPQPLVPGGGADRVEADLGRGVLYVYHHNQIVLISQIPSGGGYYQCAVARQPASSGCVRIPVDVANIFPGLVSGQGIPVYVRR